MFFAVVGIAVSVAVVGIAVVGYVGSFNGSLNRTVVGIAVAVVVNAKGSLYLFVCCVRMDSVDGIVVAVVECRLF